MPFTLVRLWPTCFKKEKGNEIFVHSLEWRVLTNQDCLRVLRGNMLRIEILNGL